RRGPNPVVVEPQVFDLLAYLIEHRDRVVGKDELISTVWAGRIVSDSALASRINAARKAIGDSGEGQRLIRTYHRKGVRFIGEVREVESAAAAEPVTSTMATGHGKPSIAVLPFANLGGDPEHDYFSDGITEDIITELSRNRGLRVIARSSSFAFRGSGDARAVGRELGADYIVQGSVRRAGMNVRVNVQLAETQNGTQLWAERYDRELQDIFEVQDQITATIAARLEPEVGIAEQQRAERKPVQALEAWDFFRLGTKTFYRSTPGSNEEAQKLFRRALALDPELAQAYGFLSYAMVLSMVYYESVPDHAALDEAVAIARRGIELDERDALVRFMYGRALLARGAYGQAIDELQLALELNPSLAVVHCGLADSLACSGRFAEAVPHFDTAITLSPHDPLRWAFMAYRALAHIFAQQFELAAHWARKATLVPNCHYLAFSHRVAALGHLGRTGELEEAVGELRQRKPDFSLRLARERLFYVKDAMLLASYLDGLARAGIPDQP